MTISIGMSKNEHLEIFLSIIFVAIGGWTISFIQFNQSFTLTFILTLVIFATGIVLALRASFKVSYDSQKNKNFLEESRKQLEESIEKKTQQVKEDANQQSINNAIVFG